jgi:long-subunit fatty acid transport protein
MKKATLKFKTYFILLLFPLYLSAQGAATPACEFWKKVQFGGGLGLNVSNGFTNISLSPSARYNVNEIFSLGLGLQGSYASGSGFSSFIYGGSMFALANVSDQIQLSVDLDQLKVNTSYSTTPAISSKHFWNTALFLGAGYRNGNITVGAKYNVLFKKEDGVYSDAFMPFVRVYF